MKVCAINRVDYDGNTYNPGDEFDCRKAVGERLLEQEIVTLPMVEVAPAIEPDTDPDAELIEQIKATATTAELTALVPEAPENPAVADVFATCWAELDAKEAAE